MIYFWIVTGSWLRAEKVTTGKSPEYRGAATHGLVTGASVAEKPYLVPTSDFVRDGGLPSRLRWHDGRCAPDSCRLAAMPKSAGSGQEETLGAAQARFKGFGLLLGKTCIQGGNKVNPIIAPEKISK
jgi:hypothetical protein